MKQTDRTPIYAACAVSPRIRNAEVRCSSHLSGTIISLQFFGNSERLRTLYRRIMRLLPEQTMISTTQRLNALKGASVRERSAKDVWTI